MVISIYDECVGWLRNRLTIIQPADGTLWPAIIITDKLTMVVKGNKNATFTNHVDDYFPMNTIKESR